MSTSAQVGAVFRAYRDLDTLTKRRAITNLCEEILSIKPLRNDRIAVEMSWSRAVAMDFVALVGRLRTTLERTSNVSFGTPFLCDEIAGMLGAPTTRSEAVSLEMTGQVFTH